MFKEFWEQKKSALEAAGLLTAIGAIFISISKPESKDAQIALFYIQMLWLIIITISISAIMIIFYLYFIKLEKKFEKKIRSFYISTDFLSSVVLITMGFFIYYAWKYLILIYKDQLSSYLKIIGPMLGMTLFSFAYYLNDKIFKYYHEGKIYKYYLLTFLESTAFGLISAAWSAIIYLNFELYNFIAQTLIITTLLAIICIVVNLIAYYKNIKNH
ncbi:MAG: hypothetical protein Q7K16_02370 [Candidatus Azambacteria bacterium]|nr:hypothetical protein [Candidatus Azambacteria bacterium]